MTDEGASAAMDTPGEKGQQIVLTPESEKGTQIVSTPAAVKRRPLSVRVDAQLSDDLAVMVRAGMTPSDAVRCAVSIVAGAYRNAWAAGVVPEGVAPLITDCLISVYDAEGGV